MKWFRMYHEARNDIKLNSLTDAQFRVWFRLMCLACECDEDGIIPLRSERIMALEVAGGDVLLYRETVSTLKELELLQVTDKAMKLSHWFDDSWGLAKHRKIALERRRMNRRAIFDRDGYKCQYCGTDKGPFEIDHIIPVSRGGASTPGSLVVACERCNRAKRDRTAEEWMASGVRFDGVD